MAREDEIKSESELFEDMFPTEGWQELVRDAEEAIEARKERMLHIGSLDELRFIQGEVAQLRILVNLQTMIRLRKEATEASETQEAELELIG